MKQRVSVLLAILLISSLLLAACAGDGGAGETPITPGQDGADATLPASGETLAPETGDDVETPEGEVSGELGLPAECTSVELNYWNPFTGPDGPYMGEMVQNFNNENENINVTMNSQADYYTQLTTAAASNTLPDVAIIHADQLATHVYRNVLSPIDDMVAQVGVSGDDFPAAVWEAGDVSGSRYAIPLDIHPMTMFYNADLLEENGITEPPLDRESFEQAAAAISEGDNSGFILTTGFPVAQIFQMLLHQFGGSEFNEDATEATWNSEAGVQALQWMKTAQEQYGEPNLEVDAELAAFKAGQVGMIWNGIWQTTNVTGDAVMFNGMATRAPQIGTQDAVWAGSHQLTLPVQPDGGDACKRAAAGLFIRYLLDNSVTWAQAGQIPASNTVRSSDEFLQIEPQASIAPSVENAIFPPAVPGITDALVPMGEAVSSVMSGEATDIQTTLDASVERANQILEENRQTYGEAPAQ